MKMSTKLLLGLNLVLYALNHPHSQLQFELHITVRFLVFLTNYEVHCKNILGIAAQGLEVIKLFSCSTPLSMKISLPINMKMPTIVGIFILVSREIFMLSYIKQERIWQC